jgi:hypothetical protein
MEWEDMLTIMKIFDKYNLSYDNGDYYNEEEEVCGHWLEIDTYIDSIEN